MIRKLSILFIALLLVIFVAGYWIRLESHKQFVKDALHTAASEIHRQLLEKSKTLSPAAMQQVFVYHHKASVSPIWLDSNGNPVDAWGTIFRVTCDSESPVSWVLCESAGPDGKFGTKDDLSFRSEK